MSVYFYRDSPFDGSYLRHQRSLEHFGDIREMIRDEEESARKGLVTYQDRQSGEWRPLRPKRPPALLSIRISEMFLNLRAALDYIVYAVAKLDSGIVQKGTQFLIEDCPDGFERQKTSRMRGVNCCHVAMFEELQPYKTGQWTARLRDFSNADKHRELQTLVGKYDLSGASFSALPTIGAEDEADPLPEVGMHFDGAVQIAFEDGTAVEETLEVLQLRLAR